jgi:hypothetical protein
MRNRLRISSTNAGNPARMPSAITRGSMRQPGNGIIGSTALLTILRSFRIRFHNQFQGTVPRELHLPSNGVPIPGIRHRDPFVIYAESRIKRSSHQWLVFARLMRTSPWHQRAR